MSDAVVPRRSSAMAALLAQSLLALAIYWPTRRLAFVADAWVYLEGLRRRGFWGMVSEPIGYHWQPVAVAWIALIRAFAGDRAVVFQAVNVAQLICVAHLGFHLGRR